MSAFEWPLLEEIGAGLPAPENVTDDYYYVWGAQLQKGNELFDFVTEDIDLGDCLERHSGIPTHERYWKNIIPKDYSIFNREGLDGDLIDTYSEQEWLNNYYYPVLPKYGQDGNFIETVDEDGNYISDTYPNNKIPFPINGPITDEFESDESLLININSNKLDIDVLDDSSGNKNFGFTIEDYKTEFDSKTLKVKQSKKRAVFKSSKTSGAF